MSIFSVHIRPTSHNVNYAIISGSAENAGFLHDYALFCRLLFSPDLWTNTRDITIFQFLQDNCRKIACFEGFPDLMKTLSYCKFSEDLKKKNGLRCDAFSAVLSRFSCSVGVCPSFRISPPCLRRLVVLQGFFGPSSVLMFCGRSSHRSAGPSGARSPDLRKISCTADRRRLYGLISARRRAS